ncbi:MAG: alanyl-tRNA editing protein AlaXM [Infirmifilum sp.]
MAKLLFQYDSYIKEFEATVTRVSGEKVFLDQTAFHPGPSGGLDTDTGWLILPDGQRVEVVKAVEEGGDIAHVLSSQANIPQGARVRGLINWDRRYRMMRLHTASHVLASVLYKKYGALVTGGHIEPEGARDDFDLPGAVDWKAALAEAIRESNEIIRRCVEVKVYWLRREEALKIPGIVKLAGRLPPEVEEIRIVEIPDVDIQADGGPHVKNTCEIGEILLVKTESKGAKRKRVYYTLNP